MLGNMELSKKNWLKHIGRIEPNCCPNWCNSKLGKDLGIIECFDILDRPYFGNSNDDNDNSNNFFQMCEN